MDFGVRESLELRILGNLGPEAWNPSKSESGGLESWEIWVRRPGILGNMGPEPWKCGPEAGNPVTWDASEADNSGKSGSGDGKQWEIAATWPGGPCIVEVC